MKEADISDEDWLAFSVTAPKLYDFATRTSKFEVKAVKISEWELSKAVIISDEYFEIGGVRYLPTMNIKIYGETNTYMFFVHNGFVDNRLMGKRR